MASFLQRATGIARTAAEVVKTRVIPPAVEYAAITKEYVATTMERNAEYVIKDPVAVEKLGYQFVFSNLAR
jgi:F-type H+-transporting ATPase subunit g